MNDKDTLKANRDLLTDLANLVEADEPILFSGNGFIEGEPCGLAVTPMRIVVLTRGVFGGDRVNKFKFSALHACVPLDRTVTLVSPDTNMMVTDLTCSARELCERVSRLQSEYQDHFHQDYGT